MNLLENIHRIAIVGATGAVGREMVSILDQWRWPADRLILLASEKSSAAEIPFGASALRVKPVSHHALAEAGLVLLASNAAAARLWAPVALEAGTAVVDNSSAFRRDYRVPLVVPEVNGEELLKPNQATCRSASPMRAEQRRDGGEFEFLDRLAFSGRPPRLVANPNCSTILLLVALQPLRQALGIERIQVCTYQAVSGAGLAGMQELREQSQVVLAGGEPACRVFPEPCAFNVFNHESPVEPDTGLNGEERKIIDETRRIWNDFNLPITPTCVRVPVMRAHSQAITVRLERSASQQELREALRQGRGICLVDDPAGTRFPTPLQASGRDDVLVGRVRPDPAEPISASGTSRSWCLFLSGDQLRKGAALNALQIASLISCGQTAVEPPRIARSPVARGC